MNNNPLLSAEEEAAREYAATRKITRMALEDNIEDFNVFDESGEVKSSFQILEVDCPWKHLIFRALKAAYNEIFIHENTAESNKYTFLSFAQEFWIFVRHYPTSVSALRVKVIKNYEAYKIDAYGLKPISTGMKEIKRFINIALSSTNFNKAISSFERDFLYTITEVKATPSYQDIKPINLNTWFTQHSWLRTDEYGIGHIDYVSLSLPKRLMASFTVTTVTALQLVQDAKMALLAFFDKAKITVKDLPDMKDRSEFKTANLFNTHIKVCTQQLINTILTNKDAAEEIPNFNNALKLILYSNCTETHLEQCAGKLNSSPPLTSIITNHPIFHFSFIVKLIQHAENRDRKLKTVPVCSAEETFFCWIMAVLSVQATNICGPNGLKLSDFRFERKTDGRITHISCNYFKTRAGRTHRTSTLPTDRYIGKVALGYIQDVTDLVDDETLLVSKPFGNPAFSKTGDVSKSIKLFTIDTLRHELDRQISKYQASNVFYAAFSTLLKNGVRKLDVNRQNLEDAKIETEVAGTFFGLSMIKTSAVYSRSASFNPDSLLNFNSHSNETERQNYLTENNLEWLNNCGRVTRSVITDLLVNVFRPSQENLTNFNTEFTKALDFINSKKDESLALQVFISESDDHKSKANDIGVLSGVSETDAADNIYVEDSKWTVMKMLHYKQQVKDNHRHLWEQSPTYLFSTVIPTLEWIEEILNVEFFCQENLEQGKFLFEKFGKELPPLFTAKIG